MAEKKKDEEETGAERNERLDAARLTEANTIADIASGGNLGGETTEGSDERKAKLKQTEDARKEREKAEKR